MARIRLIPTEDLTPGLREIAKGAEAHKLNPAIFQAAGNLPAAYETFHGVMSSPIGYIVLIGLTWAFFNHMASGLRHFVLDMGAGYELKTNEAWSVGVMVIGVILTIAFWAVILLR